MAYIPDYYVQVNAASDEFLNPSTFAYSDFEQQQGQLNFKVCNSDYIGNYFV